MRLALLGCDHELQTLLRDLPAEHTIVAAFDAAEQWLPLGALLPHVERGENWESLLVRDDVDLVIVASPLHLQMASDGLDPQVRRVDQLKKLAQAGVNLLVSHPGTDLLDAYEIEMLRREGGGQIGIWFPEYQHPTWELIRVRLEELQQITAGEQAPGVAVHWRRSLSDRSKQSVLAALARDLLLIENVAGAPQRIMALAGAAPGATTAEMNSAAWARISVQVETTQRIIVRWELARAGNANACQITIEPVDRTEEFEVTAATTDTLTAITREQKDAEWLKACRSLEALAAVEKSLQRGRTIEVAQAEQSEEHNFKGVMASAGCLLLFLTLFAVFIVALVEGLRLPLRESAIWRLWPIALILPLAGFLGLQFLQTVIQKPPSR
jgi:predicted dehydrogenase